jgi:hypothetical protein
MTGHRPGIVYTSILFPAHPALPVNRARPRMSLTASASDGYGAHRASAGVRRRGKPVWQIKDELSGCYGCPLFRPPLFRLFRPVPFSGPTDPTLTMAYIMHIAPYVINLGNPLPDPHPGGDDSLARLQGTNVADNGVNTVRRHERPALSIVLNYVYYEYCGGCQ